MVHLYHAILTLVDKDIVHVKSVGYEAGTPAVTIEMLSSRTFTICHFICHLFNVTNLYCTIAGL